MSGRPSVEWLFESERTLTLTLSRRERELEYNPFMIVDRLSVVAAALSNDPRESPRLARVAGFKGMLFDAWSANLSIPDLTGTGRREFARLLTSQDQKLVGLRLDLGPKGLGLGADVDRQIARIDQAMEAAVGLQAPLVCVDPGPLPRAAVAPKPKPTISRESAGLIILPETQPPPVAAEPLPPADPNFVSQVNSALAEIGSHADRYSVILAFSSSLASFASLNAALTAARCPWFGIDLDPVAILRDEWSIDEIFSTVGGLIRHVRAKDALIGDDNRTKPAAVGIGSVDWPKLLSRLDEAGYGGFLTLDPMELTDRAGAATVGRMHLSNLG